eukprot:7982454-Lingulodinium_polyedra.AAC.1
MVAMSASLQVCKSGSPQVRKSASPQVRNSASPQVCKSVSVALRQGCEPASLRERAQRCVLACLRGEFRAR